MINSIQRLKHRDAIKEGLAKLLAAENIRIEHHKVETAMFDVVNRILVLPIWVNAVEEDLYTLLVGHEVGHALFTPASVANDKRLDNPVLKFLFNIVEDNRIERKMLKKYRGLVPVFCRGYEVMLGGVNLEKVNAGNFIERLCAYNGLQYNGASVEFSADEVAFVNAMHKTESIEDAIRLTLMIYEYLKLEQQPPPPPQQSKGSEKSKSKSSKGEKSKGKSKEDSDSEDDEESDSGSGAESDEEESDGEDTEDSGEDESSSDGDEDSEEDDGDSSDSDSEDDSEEDEDSDDSSDGDGSSGDDEDEEEDDREYESSPSQTSKEEQSGDATQKSTQRLSDEEVQKAIEDMLNSEIIEQLGNFQKELIDQNASEQLYLSAPNVDLKDYVVPSAHVVNRLLSYLDENSRKDSAKGLDEFRRKTSPVVSFLVQEFERKKRARSYERRQVSKTGIIDTNKLFSYRYNDEIFKAKTSVAKGKKHCMVFLLDLSSSMYGNIRGTIQQLLQLVSFCRKTNIQFEVYGIHTGCERWRNGLSDKARNQNALEVQAKSNQIYVNNGQFVLLQFLSSSMNRLESEKGLQALWIAAESNGYAIGLAPSTPLDEAALVLPALLEDAKKRYSADVMNVVWLTDGGANGHLYYKGINDGYRGYSRQVNYGSEIHMFHPLTRRTYNIAREDRTMGGSYATLKVMRKIVHGHYQVRSLGFYVYNGSIEHYSRYAVGAYETNQFAQVTTNGGVVELKDIDAYESLFFIPGGASLNVDDDVSARNVASDPNAMTETFRQFAKKRVILSKFIDMIA